MDPWESLRAMPTLAEVERLAATQKKVDSARESGLGYYGPQAMRYPNSAKPIENGALYDIGRALESFDVPVAGGLGRYMRGVATGERMGPMDYLGASLDLPLPAIGAVKPAAKGAAKALRSVNVIPDWVAKKARPRSVLNTTKAKGGATVHAVTGETPGEGLMVGMFPDRSVVTEGPVTQADIQQFLQRNKDVLKNKDNFLGTWVDPDTGRTHLDVAKRFEDVRGAMKAAERKDQLAAFDLAAMTEIRSPEKWESWVRGPDFGTRLDELFKLGDDTMRKANHPSDWWEISGPGNPWERIYGADTKPQQAGFLAATAPSSPLEQNVQAATEYMRRNVKGEPIIQLGWRSPGRGNRMPMETNRVNNLQHAQAGNLNAMRKEKVRNEALAIAGDPNAMVFDTHWSKIAEDPASNIFVSPKANRVPDEAYAVLEDIVMQQARGRGMTPSEFAAKVWTGIRERMKTGELFGQKVKKPNGESLGYARILDNLIYEEAKKRGTTVAEIEALMARGDMSLFPAIFAPFAAANLNLGDGGATDGPER